MTTPTERDEQGQTIRMLMAAGEAHAVSSATDALAPDLTWITEEALYGSIWTRPGLTLPQRSLCTISALTALGQLPQLRQHIGLGLNLGLTPEEIVEIFMQLSFHVGMPVVQTSLEIVKEVFDERGIQFTPSRVSETRKTIEELYDLGVRTHREHMGDITVPETSSAPDSEEMQVERLLNAYHWGAIYTRPQLDIKSRVMCVLSAMTVLGSFDRQIRRRVEEALRMGMTHSEVMEVFMMCQQFSGHKIKPPFGSAHRPLWNWPHESLHIWEARSPHPSHRF